MKPIKHFRYDIIGAAYDGVKVHPQINWRNLGFYEIRCEPVSIADCWWLRCDEYPDELPSYITEMSDDFKFSGEE